ncbi:hypothetical protein LshimejAT787_0208550 [Lyophyllum shimeji]|uniref:Uncharacterized protein n=1 Tax=Lyophyllum shimeji TaxID=47721 RepID=A0A9P3UL68_LYOSH|nr:hypothetical protein LshimejAT787_0208550 [Lyophyllum shimeji]
MAAGCSALRIVFNITFGGQKLDALTWAARYGLLCRRHPRRSEPGCTGPAASPHPMISRLGLRRPDAR